MKCNQLQRGIRRGVGGAALAALLFAAPASAAVDSCREWRQEHQQWKTEALKRYLGGASTREVDTAVFEMLQRESYLTSCDVSVDHGRDALVGWRLVGRTPEEYGSAVAESVLERAGFDLALDGLFVSGPTKSVRVVTRPQSRWRGR